MRTAIEQQPERLDLRIKMLEVLALQRDSMSYEPLALEVQEMTNGQGSMWEHVKAMGRDLDPYNPLYGGKQADLSGYESAPGEGEAIGARRATFGARRQTTTRRALKCRRSRSATCRRASSGGRSRLSASAISRMSANSFRAGRDVTSQS